MSSENLDLDTQIEYEDEKQVGFDVSLGGVVGPVTECASRTKLARISESVTIRTPGCNDTHAQ